MTPPSILKMKDKHKMTYSEEKTKPTANAIAWDWVIEFLADLDNVDANFLDDLLNNVPQGYSSLSSNAKDKVVLKRLEKMISTPSIDRATLTPAARRRLMIAPPVSFAINPSEPARDFYERIMAKRGLDTSNFQDNIKVCIRQFILKKRADLPKCTLPKQAEVLVECTHASAEHPNVTGMSSAKVKKVRFADEVPAVYPIVSSINSSNHRTRVNEVPPRVSEKLIGKVQEAPSEDVIVPVRRNRNEFTKDQLIDMDDAEQNSDHLCSNHCTRPNEVSEKLIEKIQEDCSEVSIIPGKSKENEFTKDQLIDMDDAEQNFDNLGKRKRNEFTKDQLIDTSDAEHYSDHLGLSTLEKPSGGSLASIQNEATNLVKDHLVSKRLKKSVNDGQTTQEVLFDGLHVKNRFDETKNSSGNHTNPETSIGNGDNKAQLSYADEVLEISMNGESSPMTMVQDSPDTDLTNKCIRCGERDRLLICNTCSLVVHENCLGSSASFDCAGNFTCPICLHLHAKIALEEVKKKYELAKKKFALASDSLLKFINKDHVHEKTVPSETLGELGASNVVGNGIDANGKRKEMVNNQANVASVRQQQAEIGIVHDKTPHRVPCASPICDRDIAPMAGGRQQKQVNNCVDGAALKTQSSFERSSVQCHAKSNEREKRSNICVETSDASTSQQESVNAPKSPSSYVSMNGNIHYEGTDKVSSGEKHADVGKKNGDLQKLPVNTPNRPSPVLGTGAVLRGQELADEVCLAPDICAEAVLTDQRPAGVGAANVVEKQLAGTSPSRPSPPSKENVENKAENENGDGCFELKRRHSPVTRKSSRRTLLPSKENVEEVSGNGKGDDEPDSESKRPARKNAKRTCARRKKTVWTHEEEEMLRKGHHIFGKGDGGNTSWQKILEYGRDVFQECRLPADLKDKWKIMWKTSGSNLV